MSRPVSVVKIGGSVLSGRQSFRRAAAWLGARLCERPSERIVAVVSAEHGVTDALLATAREIAETPDPATLDLLWSTGEIRSAALLALTLQSLGVSAVATNVHQAGIEPLSGGRPDLSAGASAKPVGRADSGPGATRVRSLRLLDLLTRHDVIVVPGFLARGEGDAIVSLGRGGSDLTAVLLAAALGARRCELLKDVPGYFTADPKRDPAALPLPVLSYERALTMADEGCELIQRRALEAAQSHRLPLVVASIGHELTTTIHIEQQTAA
jgi:aspartate kinase